MKTTKFRLALATLLILLNTLPIRAEVWGKVIVDHYECDGDGSSDCIIVATNLGYTRAEVYSVYK